MENNTAWGYCSRGSCTADVRAHLSPVLFRIVLACFSVLILSPAGAQQEPNTGKNQFPQFRQLSGLSGGGFGLDETGRGSLSGPTAFSTPIGYVLGHDQFRFSIAAESFDSAPNVTINHANGKGLAMFGHTFGQFNVMVADLVKSHTLDQAYNAQLSVIPVRGPKIGVSLGVQDVLGLGGSAGQGYPTDHYTSQSIFAVSTIPIETRRGRPVYFSLGAGTRRFSKSFESVSYQFLKPLRGWLEYDGWGFNEGVLVTGHTGKGRSYVELNGNVGLIRGRYFTLAVTLGF